MSKVRSADALQRLQDGQRMSLRRRFERILEFDVTKASRRMLAEGA